MEKNNLKGIGSRVAAVRFRTWTLTLIVLSALVFYLLMSVAFSDSISIVDFVTLATLQILMHCMYFPDGELYGTRDEAYVTNKTSYNIKATKINEEHKIARLREYCLVEYEERRKRYIENICGQIGISYNELQRIDQNVPAERLMKMRSFEFKYQDGTKLVRFSKWKRKQIRYLLHGKLPIKPNHAETIMSAVESDGTKPVTDTSVGYKVRAYARKIFNSVVIGGVFAYITYTVRDGVGWAEIARILSYIASIASTAVMSYTTGETCTKVYKGRFYVDLVNFIDGFNEWDDKNPQKVASDNVDSII